MRLDLTAPQPLTAAHRFDDFSLGKPFLTTVNWGPIVNWGQIPINLHKRKARCEVSTDWAL